MTARHGIYSDDCGPNNRGGSSDDVVGCSAMKAAYGAGLLEQQNMPCYSSPNPAEETNDQATARSVHPGGVHVGLLDGSVHFVADSVDNRVWHDMHARSKRENVTIPFSE
jgi:hypothetical protein